MNRDRWRYGLQNIKGNHDNSKIIQIFTQAPRNALKFEIKFAPQKSAVSVYKYKKMCIQYISYTNIKEVVTWVYEKIIL